MAQLRTQKSSKKKAVPASGNRSAQKSSAALKQKPVVESKTKNPAEKSGYSQDTAKLLGVFALGMFCMLLIGYGAHLWMYPHAHFKSTPVHLMHGCRFVPAQPCCLPEKNRVAPYIPAEYAPYLTAGSHQIHGRLNEDMNVRVHRRHHRPENFRSAAPAGVRGSRPKTMDAAAQGSSFLPVIRHAEVFANPVTAYSREWFNRNWAGRENLKPADPRVWKTHFKGQIGPDGQFVFEHLPAGEYFVAARACVQFHPRQKGCKEVRFGKRVRTDGQQPVVLDVVYREK